MRLHTFDAPGRQAFVVEMMGIYMRVFMGFSPFGSLIAGTIAEDSGSLLGAGFGGAVALAAGLFWLVRAPHVRRLE